MNWISVIDLLKVSVDSNSQLTNSEKSKNPWAHVEGENDYFHTVTFINYPIAMQLLEERYEYKRICKQFR